MTKIISFVAIILVAQVILYFLLGENSLIATIGPDKEFFKYTPRIITVVYDKSEYPHEEDEISLEGKAYLESSLKKDFDSVSSISSTNNFDHVGNVLYYYLSVERTNYFISYVNESLVLKNEEYDMLTGADWKSTYIWVLFKWIRIKKVNTGIS